MERLSAVHALVVRQEMMLLQYVYYQILSYGLWWIPFLGVTIFLARAERRSFFILILLIIPPVIYILDIKWIRSEMAEPSWDGTPDMDMIFMIWMLFRIFLITTLLSIMYFVSRSLFKRLRTSREIRAEQDMMGNR